MPAAIEAHAVVWGERGQDVLVQGSRIRREEVAGTAPAGRDVSLAVSCDLGVRLAIGGGVVSRNEDLTEVVAEIFGTVGGVAA